MSWVYWGIVIGLAALVVTLMISIDIYYRTPNEPDGEITGDPSGKGKKAGSATKHAA